MDERRGGPSGRSAALRVAMFADLHGGRARVEGRAGGGASFRIFLAGEPGAGSTGNGEGRPASTSVAREVAG